MLRVYDSLKVPAVACSRVNTTSGWLMSVTGVQAILRMGQPQTTCMTG